jgi:GTP:adenosylcobinamide-phosphate guanylyltransferase
MKAQLTHTEEAEVKLYTVVYNKSTYYVTSIIYQDRDAMEVIRDSDGNYVNDFDLCFEILELVYEEDDNQFQEQLKTIKLPA